MIRLLHDPTPGLRLRHPQLGEVVVEAPPQDDEEPVIGTELWEPPSAVWLRIAGHLSILGGGNWAELAAACEVVL